MCLGRSIGGPSILLILFFFFLKALSEPLHSFSDSSHIVVEINQCTEHVFLLLGVFSI